MKTVHKHAHSSEKGFTLIELLVVVAVIALLISLLLPALGKARDAAQSAIGMSNKRQIALSIHVYASDHRTGGTDINGSNRFDKFASTPGNLVRYNANTTFDELDLSVMYFGISYDEYIDSLDVWSDPKFQIMDTDPDWAPSWVATGGHSAYLEWNQFQTYGLNSWTPIGDFYEKSGNKWVPTDDQETKKEWRNSLWEQKLVRGISRDGGTTSRTHPSVASGSATPSLTTVPANFIKETGPRFPSDTIVIQDAFEHAMEGGDMMYNLRQYRRGGSQYSQYASVDPALAENIADQWIDEYFRHAGKNQSAMYDGSVRTFDRQDLRRDDRSQGFADNPNWLWHYSSQPHHKPPAADYSVQNFDPDADRDEDK